MDLKSMAVIEIRNLTKHYGESIALEDASFDVKKGEIFAILGPSGCGKTTTLRLIVGFEEPDEGKIWVDGRKVAGDGIFMEPQNRKVGMVFQDYALFPHLTVQDNILFGLNDIPREKRGGVVKNMLRFVGLEGYSDRYPNQLSGGQQQRVALARALAPCPVVILLDEPLSNLDADMRVQMREELLTILREARTTVILVTHDQEEAFSMADKVAVMNQGRIEQIGIPEEIYHSPRTRFVADFVGKADFLEGVSGKGRIETEIGVFTLGSELEDGVIVELMIRPDDITFTRDENGPAVIVERKFKGEENLYTLRLGSGKILHSSRSSTFLMEKGATIKIQARPAHVVVFKGTKAIAEVN